MALVDRMRRSRIGGLAQPYRQSLVLMRLNVTLLLTTIALALTLLRIGEVYSFGANNGKKKSVAFFDHHVW